MKNQFRNLLICATAIASFAVTSCEKSVTSDVDPVTNQDRWITVAGALMGTTAGDGDGGTVIYSISKEDARNPNFAINVYEKGFPVKSTRTARLQASEDGQTIFNIAYSGDNGGEFARYKVGGGGIFTQQDVTVNISQYATTTPRWAKLYDGDKTGIAVNVASIAANNATDKTKPFQFYRGTATVLALDLQKVLINGFKQYQLPLSAEEELKGHTIFRLDAPVLNKAQNKLILGTWMRKYNTATGAIESTFERLGSKSVVVDYPSLENPKIISSTVGFGDNSGYRSPTAYLTEDGTIYQATNRDSKGSHILKINANNEYDNSYVFSLDAALGVKGVYQNNWKYAGNGIGYVLYTVDGSNQSYIARVDLNAKTAIKVNIEYDADLNFFQYQGILVSGDEVYVAVTPTGKDGYIYIFNKKTGAITKGAKLLNKAGNHYIGIF